MQVSNYIIGPLAAERTLQRRAPEPPDSRRAGIATLFVSAVGGDPSSWEALVSEVGRVIRTIARSHRLSDADAADVAQVTWLRLLEHLEDLREPASVAAWLSTTARRECLHVLRDGSRRTSLGAQALREPESPEAPPDRALLRSERDRALWRGFDRLRPSDQTLLRLLMAEPRPDYDRISSALQIPIGSIGPTRARALERLRRELDHDGALALLST